MDFLDSDWFEIGPCDSEEIVFVEDISIFVGESLMIEIENFEENQGVWVEEVLCWKVEKEFYNKGKFKKSTLVPAAPRISEFPEITAAGRKRQ